MTRLPQVRFSADRLMELAEVARLGEEPWVKDSIRAAVVSGNVELAEKVGHILQIAAMEEVLRGVPFGIATPEELFEDIDAEKAALIGVIFDTDKPFLYLFDWLNQHACVVGGTGTGKTNTLYSIALQTMRHCPVWIIDRDKEDYRHLLRLVKNLHVLDAAKDLRFNPFEVPPGVKPEHQLTSAVSIGAKSNNFLDGAESMLMTTCHTMYEERGVFVGSRDFPTLFDIRDRIRSYKFNRYSRNAGYQDSLLNRFDSYVIAAPELYGCSKGFPIAELARRNIVLEVKGLSERHSRCLVNWLLFTLFLYRIANGLRGNTLEILVIIDEAKWLVPPGYNPNLGFLPLASVLAQSREAGIGLVIADQTADLDPAVMVNSRLKMCMRLGSGADMERVRKTFALSKEQEAYIPKLDTGQAIVRIPKVDPFLIKVPRVRLG